MIEIYSKDMTKLIGYTIQRYRLNFPDDMSREDLEQEVAVGLLAVPHEITSTHVVMHTLWSRTKIWKDAISRQHAEYPRGIGHRNSDDPIHAKESVKKILGIERLTEQERNFLKCRSEGLDSREIMTKMGLNNRQRFEQIKRVAFNKVREYCHEAKYWEEV